MSSSLVLVGWVGRVDRAARTTDEHRRDARDDHLRAERRCQLGCSLQSPLCRVGVVVSEDDGLHGDPPCLVFTTIVALFASGADRGNAVWSWAFYGFAPTAPNGRRVLSRCIPSARRPLRRPSARRDRAGAGRRAALTARRAQPRRRASRGCRSVGVRRRRRRGVSYRARSSAGRRAARCRPARW